MSGVRYSGARFTRALATMPFLLCCAMAFARANPGMAMDPTVPKSLRSGDVVSEFHDGRYGRFSLRYVHGTSIVELRHAGRETTVLRIPRGHDPALVGAEMGNRFLPPSLQPYIGQGKLLLVVALRTTGGGGGQCGAGVEQYLKVADVHASRPRVIASHLIESCAEGTEFDSQGRKGDPFPSFYVAGGELRIRFLSYRNRLDGPFVGRLSADFQRVTIEKSHVGKREGDARS